MTSDKKQNPIAQVAEKHKEPRLNDALLRLKAGHTVEEARTFFPSTAGVLEDAWNELQTEYDIQPSDVGNQDLHARSLKYSNPIDPTVAMAMKSMHGPKLEDSPHHPDRYYSPAVLSMTWHEPVDGEDYTTEKGFLIIYEIAGGAGYLIEGQAGAEYWTVGVKAFEKELIQIFKPDHHWKIDYTTGEKIRTLLKTIGVYESNLAPRFDEEHDVRDYPDDYEAVYHARNDWPGRVFEAYE